MILDGWGLSSNKSFNAIENAHTPNYDYLKEKYPNTILKSSGLAVGLPEGQMGNSEVGHLNIGAGRIVYQEYTRISKDIENKNLYKNEVLREAMKNAKKEGNVLHLMGLLSDGGVHSHINHLKALLNFAKMEGVRDVFIHAFLDGRDVPPANAKIYIKDIESYMEKTGIGKIATISGRYYAMDRDKRWDRTEKAYNALVYGQGYKAENPIKALEKGYDRGETDEFIKPTVIINEDSTPVGPIKSQDSVIFFNFRPDRARQLTYAFLNEDFNGFERNYFPVHFVCMTQYDADIKNANIAYMPSTLENIFSKVISEKGLKQLRIAETEKYAHVTFFFNGGVEKNYPGEDRILIPSPKVATYDLKPEMSAYKVCEKVIEKIDDNIYDVIILNFANPDMVGHTGVYDAAVTAIETVDKCIGKIADAIIKAQGMLLITADHGNAEKMKDENQKPYTAHTTNDVPFILVSKNKYELCQGKLADIAPTMLQLLGIPKPKEMTGNSLIIK